MGHDDDNDDDFGAFEDAPNFGMDVTAATPDPRVTAKPNAAELASGAKVPELLLNNGAQLANNGAQLANNGAQLVSDGMELNGQSAAVDSVQ